MFASTRWGRVVGMTAADIAGWVPAVVLPTATAAALAAAIRAARQGDTTGVSVLSWVLFAAANLGGWVYTEKLLAPQALIAYAVTTVLDVVIIVVVLAARHRERPSAE